MSEKYKTVKNAFETAKLVVTLVGVAIFLVILFLGYIATGGGSLGGFLGWVLGAR